MPTGIEIERKFLLEEAPGHLDTYDSEQIEQGYLAGTDALEVRLRRRGDRAFLTIKSSGDRIRVEEEIEIDERRFRSLWPLTEGRRLQKKRYRIPQADGLVVELDVYEGALAGLITAEIEFDSPHAAAGFAAPGWLGREVTDDPSYKNKRLAVHGRPA
jgi:adenylate cyclase